MSAHRRLEGYRVAEEIGRRLAGDPAVREALRAYRHGRARAEMWDAEESARAVRDAVRPHLPPGLEAWPSSTIPPWVLVLWSMDEAPGWDLHARALERGEVLPVLAPDGSGEVVGI
jgi:hypothetical protein